VLVWQGETNIAKVNQGANPGMVASDMGNVFVARTPETFMNDADGKLTLNGRWNYTWDVVNRLIKVESRSDTPSSSWRRIEWTYDALGRRIQQVTSIWTNNAWFVVENLKFVSDPMLFGRHIAELNATNNTLIRSYVWGLDLSRTMDGVGGVGGLLWVTLHTTTGSASGTHFTCYDGNGNIVALVSATTGDVTARYEYGPFGEPIRVTGPAASLNLFRLSKKRTDNNTDLVLYEYRDSPSLGRWVSRYPIEEYGGLHLYWFLENNPINYFYLYGLVESLTIIYLRHPIPQSERLCCDEAKVKEGELRKRYKNAAAEAERLEIKPVNPPPWGRCEATCKNSSQDVIEYLVPTLQCWQCYLEERNYYSHEEDPADDRLDHQVIICVGYFSSGVKR